MTPDDEIHSSEDEAIASDLDMHALILGGLHQDHECPVKTADEVESCLLNMITSFLFPQRFCFSFTIQSI